MPKLITLKNAKSELERLQSYILLVESYDGDSLDKKIIKECALTNSLVKVADKLNKQGITNDGNLIDKQFLISVIDSKPKDELHKIIRSGYRIKAGINKRKSKK
jgi:hypothetical protein